MAYQKIKDGLGFKLWAAMYCIVFMALCLGSAKQEIANTPSSKIIPNLLLAGALILNKYGRFKNCQVLNLKSFSFQ